MTGSPSPSEPAARRAPVWATVLLGAAVAVILSLLFGEPPRRALFDQWQRLAPREVSTDRVAVVLIDPLSLEAVGTWPWPRYYMARLTERIAAQGPEAIGFDMIFVEPDPFDPAEYVKLYPEMADGSKEGLARLQSLDEKFADALGRAPAVLGRLGIAEEETDPDELFFDEIIEGDPPPASLTFDHLLASIPELDFVALGHAALNGPPDNDGIVRRVPIAVRTGSQWMPGLAAQHARIASGSERIVFNGQSARIGKRVIPVDASGRMELRFGVFPRTAPFSAAKVIAGQVPEDAFAGKVVLIGLGAEGTADIVATPLLNEDYGVLVQAQAIDAMLTGGWLARPVWLEVAEWFAAALLVFLVALSGGTGRRSLFGLAIGIALLLPLASWFAFDLRNLLFDPVRPLLIGGFAALSLEGILFVRAARDRARLAEALVEQRVASAAHEGELQAARAIQLGMLPRRERLTALDPRVEIGAMLQPARSVGGDFYDVMRIDEDRLLFLIADVTGKGVPAALYMALSKALAKSVLVREQGGLARGIRTLNRELMRDGDDAMGVSMLCVLIDCSTGDLLFCNAGHENPIRIGRDGSVATLPLEGGPPFCVDDYPYPEEPGRLAPGETLVLITDGITEAQDPQGRLFGVAATEAALEVHKGSAESLVTGLLEAVRGFESGADPSDDLTILAIGYRGPAL